MPLSRVVLVNFYPMTSSSTIMDCLTFCWEQRYVDDKFKIIKSLINQLFAKQVIILKHFGNFHRISFIFESSFEILCLILECGNILILKNKEFIFKKWLIFKYHIIYRSALPTTWMEATCDACGA